VATETKTQVCIKSGNEVWIESNTDRFGAIESNSSKNNTHGFAALALSKISRTDFSLAPMYLFSSSGPLMLMKFKPHSFAAAEARSVFPQPG